LDYFYVNNIKINNIEKDRNIIDYLENLNIKIPHFCYHQSLSVAGNCRMCLIELKNSTKPLISCAMSITNKMEIFTDSPLVKKARENILEFLLFNHPLDCPICDQGGECDLQDQSMIFGTSKKRFYIYKRSVNNKNLGPIVKTVMTRCIHCTRCVRFANEIVGIEDLGVFGRGNSMEIGTYVEKIFNSEISGNVIDICPVGALTSKPYSFFDRVWELKNVSSIDYSDGLNINIQISIKNDSFITKISPNFDKQEFIENWISDKTRFSFDGMFSPERLSTLILTNEKSYFTNSLSWKQMLKEILLIFYFKNHFLKHFLEVPILTIVINHSVSTELLNFLLLLEKKYKFIKIKQIKSNNTSKDLNTHLLINSANNVSKLNSSNLILLIGLNTRLESSTLNIKLRQRFLKGNCKIFTINSLVDLAFSTINLGSNINIFKNIIEGTHFFCQELKFAKNPILIYNSTLFSRNDSSIIDFLIDSLNDKVKINFDNWKGINCVSSALNEVGINLSGLVKTFKSEDFMDSSGLYFINSNIYSTPILKLLELKILNYFKIEKYSIKYLIEQNNISSKMFHKINSYVYLGLPNFTLFEDSGTYQNSEGIFKNMIQIIPSLTKYSKSNWHILRRLFSYVDNNMFIEKKIILNFENYSTIIEFNNFQVYTVSSLNKYVTTPLNLKSNKVLTLKKYLKQNLNKKLFKTKTILWLDDFYIGGKDLYSKFSKVMIECSKSLRLIATNFTYNV
jgi:NADH-quinone oxidoreductase chain G